MWIQTDLNWELYTLSYDFILFYFMYIMKSRKFLKIHVEVLEFEKLVRFK